jgi:anti-sigma regulatory factor (Ser/Thr protein kinase)
VQGRAITRAVDEALTNVIRHAYSGRVDQRIQVFCRRIRRSAIIKLVDGLEIMVCDWGPAINPAKLQGRPLDEIRPGGLGLHFIRQSMDSVEFKRVNGANTIRMIKYLSQQNQQA